MRGFFIIDRFIKSILENRPIYGQDSIFANELKEEQPSPQSRRRFTDQCALDNRLPSLVMAWMVLIMEFIMTVLFLIQPFVSRNTPFDPKYIYLYVSMVVINILYLILLHIYRNSPSRLMLIQLILLAAMGIWSAIFSAVDIISGFSSYLFIQITIIQALLYRGRPVSRCLFNIAGFIVYTALLISGDLSFSTLFAELINPFFMAVVSCGIILMNDHIHYKSFRNLELIKNQHEQLSFYANNDYLTGIPNRKSIAEYLDGIISSGDSTVTCVMLDIDNFKMYNDICGHTRGDDCLKQMGMVMQGIVETRGGRIGRYGGEEFLAVFHGLDEEKSLLTAQNIVKAIENEKIGAGCGISCCDLVTVSAGVAVGNAGQSDPRILIQNADTAMYRAKSTGKNRACLFREQSGAMSHDL